MRAPLCAQCEPLCEHLRTWLATLSPKSGTSQPETPTLLELCKLNADARDLCLPFLLQTASVRLPVSHGHGGATGEQGDCKQRQKRGTSVCACASLSVRWARGDRRSRDWRLAPSSALSVSYNCSNSSRCFKFSSASNFSCICCTAASKCAFSGLRRLRNKYA